MKFYKLVSEKRGDGLKRLIAKEDLPMFGITKGDKGGLVHPSAELFDNARWWVFGGGTIWGGTIEGGTIEGGTIEGGTIRGGTIRGGTIEGGTIEGGTIRGGTIRGGTIWGGTIEGGTIEGGADFLVVGPIGSRGATTTFVRDGDTVVCGCFKGTMAEFEAKVNAMYPEGVHGDEYRGAIALAKVHFARAEGEK